LSLLYIDPCKLSLKEVESIIIYCHLENQLQSLMDELNRVNYDGYIKLSKPKDYYSREDWESIFTTLQDNIIQAKVETESNPLPEFLDKMLKSILSKNDFSGFQRFLNTFTQYLPEELVKVRDNQQFIKWVFSHLKNNTLTLDQSSLRLSAEANPEDIGF
jgi:hypothetical protein